MYRNLKWIIGATLMVNSLTVAAAREEACGSLFYSSMSLLTLPSAKGQVISQKMKKAFETPLVGSLEALHYISANGIDDFVTASLNGQFPYEHDLVGMSANLYDLALVYSAKPESLQKLKKISLTPTAYSFVLSLRSKDIAALVGEYAEYGVDVNMIRISHSGKQLSLVNYLIINDKIRLAEKLVAEGLLSANNAYDGNLLDLNKLPLASLAKIADLVDIVQYKKLYAKTELAGEVQKSLRKTLKDQYRDYYLIELCADSYKNLTPNQVVFAYTRKEVNAVLHEQGLTIKSDITLVAKKVANPVIVDLVAKIQNDSALGSINRVNKERSNIDNNKANIIRLTGVTLEEELYLDSKTKWRNGSRHRLFAIAKYLADNDSVELRKKLVKDSLLRKSYYLGKNFTYHLMLVADDKALLTWSINNMGSPESVYGTTIFESLKINSLYYPKAFEKIKLLKGKKKMSDAVQNIFTTALVLAKKA